MGNEAVDKKKLDQYAAQAKERWGSAEAYKEFEQKSYGRSRETEASLAEQMMDIFAEFGAIRDEDPSSAAAQDLVKKLQAFITDNYYTCTKEILGGLGQMYGAEGAFGRNIDKAGREGTAAFVSKAIEVFGRSINMEYWDLYDKDRKALNRLHARGEAFAEGEYYVCAEIWVRNTEGELLVTKRHPNKKAGN